MIQNNVDLKDITVLYCEDEDDLRTVTGGVIAQFTKKVHIAQNGKIGFDLFKKYANEIDLIITDVNMPQMNGLEMTKAIKDLNPNIPIIVATAFSNSDYLLEAIELGVDKYVLKPIDLKKLFSVMKQSLLYHELQDLYRDTFTHLPNRNALIRDLLLQSPSTVALVDINEFATINELYGEQIGDDILLKFAQIIQENFSKDEYQLYRAGADKFVLRVLKYSSNCEDILYSDITNFVKLINEIGLSLDNNTINLTVTVAIATSDDHTTFDKSQRVRNIAKKDFIEIMRYDKDIHDTHIDYKENILWIKKLRTGLTDGHFKGFFQPIIDAKTGKIYKYESLIRYVEDNGDVISPYKFLPIAKKARLYSGIIYLMIEECINFIKQKHITVSVNVSFDDIKNIDINNFILKKLEENKDITNYLHFELLETEEIKDFGLVRNFIEHVQSYGCQVGVDDFGAGYSNFNMIEALKVDFIKIDGSLIKSVDTDNTQELIVETIAGYAKKANVKTVAEFVSKESIYITIQTLGIDYAQGYYFSQAIGIEDID